LQETQQRLEREIRQRLERELISWTQQQEQREHQRTEKDMEWRRSLLEQLEDQRQAIEGELRAVLREMAEKEHPQRYLEMQKVLEELREGLLEVRAQTQMRQEASESSSCTTTPRDGRSLPCVRELVAAIEQRSVCTQTPPTQYRAALPTAVLVKID